MSQIHPQVRTKSRILTDSQASASSLTGLAERRCIMKAIARKWKSSDSTEDCSHRPQKLNTTLELAQEELRDLIAMTVTSVDEQERAQVWALCEAVQEATARRSSCGVGGSGLHR